MTKYKEKIIQKFSEGINRLSILMRKLTACDEDILLKNAQGNKTKLQSIYDLQQQNLAESLSLEVAEKIQDRVRSAIDPGYSDLSMFVISKDTKLTKSLKNSYTITCKKLSKVPDDIDIKYKDKELNYKDVKAYTALEISKQNEINKDACHQLLEQTNNAQTTDELKQTLALS